MDVADLRCRSVVAHASSDMRLLPRSGALQAAAILHATPPSPRQQLIPLRKPGAPLAPALRHTMGPKAMEDEGRASTGGAGVMGTATASAVGGASRGELGHVCPSGPSPQGGRACCSLALEGQGSVRGIGRA
jgi:hypothetical protein